jgi:hypothetical protein
MKKRKKEKMKYGNILLIDMVKNSLKPSIKLSKNIRRKDSLKSAKIRYLKKLINVCSPWV